MYRYIEVGEVEQYEGGCGAEVVAFTRSLCHDPRFTPIEDAAAAGGTEGLDSTIRDLINRGAEAAAATEPVYVGGGGGGGGGGDGDEEGAKFLDGGGDQKRGHSDEMLALGHIISEARRLRLGHGYCGERLLDMPAIEPAAVAAKVGLSLPGVRLVTWTSHQLVF